MSGQRFLIALGSNMPHHRFGAPRRVVSEALRELDRAGLTLCGAAPCIASRPLGPSRRTYANSVALVVSDLPPPRVLERLQAIERRFGRRRRGSRWGPRVLDLDIVLWSGGIWHSPGLAIPHVRFRERRFVLQPAARLAPRWRDPESGLTLTHLAARLTRPKPHPTARPRSGP
ncbi:MAG: 2-amino-4-hydroxy-6-hydroxymethyldihydropteridine diphosphokinase [Novosphingobium sp.]